MADNQGGHPGSPSCSSGCHEDPAQDRGPTDPTLPSKPIAYVMPMKQEAPAPPEPPHTAPRGRRGPRGRGGQRSQRGWRGGRGISRVEEAFQWEPAQSEELGHPRELNSSGGTDHPVGSEAMQAPTVPVNAASTVNEAVLLGLGDPEVRLWRRLQALPLVSRPEPLLGQQELVSYPYVVFSPLAGSGLHFTQTGSGTLVSGVPLFSSYTRL
ncbi:proline-rich protein 20G-like [Marmota marmota marmota]|uniref:proline-rich protein 20G-like n=1 Tax=Marmota marmota marmota TaxID=9994 RepID=UPI0020932346|nr:proline-rich protein 20G-like [Marmota marmota marmota]